jgi:hypothetical protein
MFSFFIKYKARIELAVKIIAFALTVIIEAVKTISDYINSQTTSSEPQPA